MQTSNIFFNSTDRLRSGWRAAIYVLAIVVLSLFAGAFLQLIGILVQRLGIQNQWIAGLIEVLPWAVLFGVALIAGWGCGRLLEDLPWKALGWSFHKGAMRDLLIGCIVGSASLGLAVLIAMAFGGLRLKSVEAGAIFAVLRTLVLSGLVFVIAAAAEEAVFRGYALQTFARARLIWVGVALTLVAFALIHMRNPNVVPGFTFINTALAGLWLAAAYLKTRSLWFALGVHWAWNWSMAAVFGIPVSGITELTPDPIFRASDLGPAWLTGGQYGLEGGAACTVVLVLSTLFIWRTKLVSATAEMTALTTHEMPTGARTQILNTDQPPASE